MHVLGAGISLADSARRAGVLRQARKAPLPACTPRPPAPHAQVQDQQAGVRGWLFARGAFDRNDLVYLRNEEERQRLAEREQDASERQAVSPQRRAARRSPAQPQARCVPGSSHDHCRSTPQ